MPSTGRKRSTNPRSFLTDEEQRAVERAVAAAEAKTSAEVKLVIVRHCWGDLREKALRTFRKLGLDRTRRHNAVLIMIVSANRQLAIYGDRGINRHAGEDFWFDVRDEMLEAFRARQVGEGLCRGIERIGEKLAAFFPRDEADINEIRDDVAFDE